MVGEEQIGPPVGLIRKIQPFPPALFIAAQKNGQHPQLSWNKILTSIRLVTPAKFRSEEILIPSHPADPASKWFLMYAHFASDHGYIIYDGHESWLPAMQQGDFIAIHDETTALPHYPSQLYHGDKHMLDAALRIFVADGACLQ